MDHVLRSFLQIPVSFRSSRKSNYLQVPDRQHTDVGLNTPVDDDTEDTGRCNIGARRKVVPVLEFRPNRRNHVLKETTSLQSSKSADDQDTTVGFD
jgi:hypothetical protein